MGQRCQRDLGVLGKIFRCLVGLALTSAVSLAEEASEGAKPSAPSEEALQKAMREEALKLEIEMTRAEREGEEAVYNVRYARTKKLAEKANQSKSLTDVLIFEKVSNETLASFRTMTERRVRKAWAERGARSGDGSEKLIEEAIERQYNQEKANIEGLLDDSLRNL
jgi:hypothetical protein